MSGFFMIAGTVLTDLGMNEMQLLLRQQGIVSHMQDDELRVEGACRIYFREGFDHEFILVGDAREESELRQESTRLSAALKSHGIQHAYELYDKANEPIADYEFCP
jgi:hypothetical protein